MPDNNVSSVNLNSSASTATSSNANTSQTASQAQVTTAQANVKRTREQITAYINERAAGTVTGANHENFLDIDGDGQVNEFDADIINAYRKGQRGTQLRDEVSPYANSSISSIRQMEAKIQSLIDNKTLDVDNDGKFNSTDTDYLKTDIGKFQDDQTKAQLQRLIREGGFNIDGNNTTDDKDIKLLKAFFVDKKSVAEIAGMILGPTADPSPQFMTDLGNKLTALANNRYFDFNIDGETDKKDIDNVSNLVKDNNKTTQQTNTTNKVKDLVDNKTIDVDGDGRVTTEDVDILEAYKNGVRGKSLRNKASVNSSLTAAQIEARTKALFDNKSLDTNNNGNIGSGDFGRLRKAAKANEEKLEKEAASALITNKTIDADASGAVDKKDIDLIDAYLDGKTGNKLKKYLPANANIAEAEARLRALIDNNTIDVNKDGKIDNEDVKILRRQLNSMGNA